MKDSRRFSWMLLLAWLVPCHGGELPENQVKSAYVLNFAKFVEWPSGTTWPNNKIFLCILGREALNGELARLDGRRVGEREISVSEMQEAGSNFEGCHMVFVGESERRRAVAVIGMLEGKSVLTVSDIEDFAELGGGIGLRVRKDKVVFEVNLASTRRAQLRVPAQLLKLAADVHGR